MGSSGCGKSTVARAVMQLLPQGTICEGRLALTGQDPRQLRRPQLRQLRGEAVGLVFQDPMTRMNPLMSVGGHLIDTLRAHRPQISAAAHQERARELLERVGIGANRFRAYTHELSGGMRQRLAIALAIALEPPLLIADEPTTSLDVAVAHPTTEFMGVGAEAVGTNAHPLQQFSSPFLVSPGTGLRSVGPEGVD